MAEDATETQRENGNGLKRTRQGKVRLPSLNDVDKRTAAFHAIVDLRDRLIAERGGEDSMDIRARESCESWAIVTTILKGIEVAWLSGLPVDFAEYSSLLNARRREGELIGDPQPRDITPDIRAYAAMNAAEKAQQ